MCFSVNNTLTNRVAGIFFDTVFPFESEEDFVFFAYVNTVACKGHAIS